jgi:hypothetical protein
MVRNGIAPRVPMIDIRCDRAERGCLCGESDNRGTDSHRMVTDRVTRENKRFRGYRHGRVTESAVIAGTWSDDESRHYE